MTVNLNANIAANQAANRVSIPLDGVKARSTENKLLESPERVNPSRRPERVNTDENTLQRLDEDRSNRQSSGNFDAPNRNAQKALNAYRDVQLADKREEIQSLVGVDLFA